MTDTNMNRDRERDRNRDANAERTGIAGADGVEGEAVGDDGHEVAGSTKTSPTTAANTPAGEDIALDDEPQASPELTPSDTVDDDERSGNNGNERA